MFDNILVPLDGSPFAEQALHVAACIADGDDKITLVRAVRLEMMMVPADGYYDARFMELDYNRQLDRAKTYLNDKAGSVGSEGVTAECVTEVGIPAELILDTAAEKASDLIVMSTHGYRGPTRWALGSVTERVLRHAPCPVLAVRDNKPISNILIPLDGSELAEAAIEPALELAERFGARVTLFRADENRPLDDRSIDYIEQFDQGLAESMRVGAANAAHDYLSGVRVTLETTADVEIASRRGNAIDGILDTAESLACDLIAMSTHGRTGIRRWVYGSVTERVLRHTDRAMLIVRPDEDD